MLYVHGEADALVENVSAFTAAIREGNLTRGEALSLYVAARTPYKRIEPVALPFSDLDAAIDARAAYLEKRELDPAFTGFHRLEYGLFEKRSRDGLVPVAGKLDADAAVFAARLKETVPPPEKVVMGAAKMIERDAAMTVSGDENRYASTGLADIAANVEGARKIADLMKSLTGKTDPALAERIDAGFAAVEEALAKHRTPEGGFVSFDLLSDSDRAELNVRLTRLAESLSRLGGALGLG
jgi:iron uptake system component EfeO